MFALSSIVKTWDGLCAVKQWFVHSHFFTFKSLFFFSPISFYCKTWSKELCPFSHDRQLWVNFISSLGRGYFWMTSSLLLFVPFRCIFINQRLSGRRSEELYSSESTFYEELNKAQAKRSLRETDTQAKPILYCTAQRKSLTFIQTRQF